MALHVGHKYSQTCITKDIDLLIFYLLKSRKKSGVVITLDINSDLSMTKTEALP
jgi:hypothetical protein